MLSRLLPLAVLTVLATVTVLVWHQQVEHQRQLVARHTDDVCYQASRRLETFMRDRLHIAEIFAARWATHESRDFSRRRFEEFSEVLSHQTPSFTAIALVHPDGADAWVVPPWNTTLTAFLGDAGAPLLESLSPQQNVTLSAPVRMPSGDVSIFAILPLRRQAEPLGHLAVELRVKALVNECFGDRLRAEFALAIADGEQSLFQHQLAIPPAALGQLSMSCSQSIAVANRRWLMWVTPRGSWMEETGWSHNLSFAAFGFTLSAVLAGLVLALQRRSRSFRRSRDDALRQVAARMKAESDLRRSERRYRHIFDSAAEGLILYDFDGQIIEANGAACSMHGYPVGGLVGQSIRDLIAEDWQKEYDRLMLRLLAKGSAYLESVDVRVDGTHFDVEVRTSHFANEGRSFVLAIINDVSERYAGPAHQQRDRERGRDHREPAQRREGSPRAR